ncbi:MAG TPA: tannase/feruloyl esterase family alpha/beta hydrolase [Acetobacteraceae bacterium]|nr:tannase/feruloyl esterase family alpha/beta hydrolase [Acetobacteraceae bacterium]
MTTATTAVLSAALLLAGVASVANAAPTCTADALNALNVPGVHIDSAKAVDANGAAPAHCDVQGTVATHGEGAPDGSARFVMQLPQTWQQRFFFMGVGGNAGRLVAATNPTDHAEALGKGYAVILTDTGHTGNGTDADWVMTPDGKRDAAKVTDFFYRGAHDVTLAGKLFAQAYYAAPVQHAYFDGCSNGGRMAMMEADRYPADYDGIIAGDPGMDYNSVMLRLAVQKLALASPAAYIPQQTLAAIDARVTARCDAIDGAKDGLVQNPARCPMRDEDLICHDNANADCLTPDQARVLHAYTTPLRDRRGHLLYPGWAITNLSGPRGISYWTTGDTPPNLAAREAPWGSDPAAPPRGWMFAHQALTYWLGLGPDANMATADVDAHTNTASDRLVAEVHRALGPGETKDPAKLLAFIHQGRKLIIYHGASDPAIPAARSIWFYHALATTLHGMDKARASVRLFLVPGMQHCGGGIGPDQFDTLTALEGWVEHGVAPQSIPASTRPGSSAPHHLPLCPYPQQARFSGSGSLDDAANWKCMVPPRDTAGRGHQPGAG